MLFFVLMVAAPASLMEIKADGKFTGKSTRRTDEAVTVTAADARAGHVVAEVKADTTASSQELDDLTRHVQHLEAENKRLQAKAEADNMEAEKLKQEMEHLQALAAELEDANRQLESNLPPVAVVPQVPVHETPATTRMHKQA
jgi:DNA repair exonuclease SbcCD ATPase subunit